MHLIPATVFVLLISTLMIHQNGNCKEKKKKKKEARCDGAEEKEVGALR